jgi:hypothetical protein
MGLTVNIGAEAPLSLQLPDGATTKSVVATIVAADGTPVDTVGLTHKYNGLYTGTFIPSSAGNLFAQFVVYNDSGATNLDQVYSIRTEDYNVIPAAVVANTYRVRMSTSYDHINLVQEVIAWAERNGERATSSSNCTVAVRRSSGNDVWSASLATPNSDGVFRFVNSFTEGTDKTFYVVIGINVDGVTRVGQEPFFTVG